MTSSYRLGFNWCGYQKKWVRPVKKMKLLQWANPVMEVEMVYCSECGQRVRMGPIRANGKKNGDSRPIEEK